MNQYFYMNAAELLDKVFDIYKKSFWMNLIFGLVVKTIIGIIGIVFAIIAAIIGVTAFMPMLLNSSASAFYNNLEVPVIVFIVISVIALFFYLVINYGVGLSGSLFFSQLVFYGKRLDLSDVLLKSFKSILRVVSVILAQVLIILPLFLVIVGIIFLMANNSSGYGLLDAVANFLDSITIGAEFFIAIFLFIIILFAIEAWFSTILIASIPAAIFEKKYFFSAVKRGYTLIKPDFWKIFGILVCWTLIIQAFSYSTMSVFYTIVGGITFFSDNVAVDPEVFFMATNIYQYIISSIISVLIMPFSGILSAVIYYNQKIKLEGLDISISLELLQNKNFSAPITPQNK